MATSKPVADILHKLVEERSLTLSQFFEEQRYRLTSTSTEEREEGLEFLSSIITKLPTKLLSDKEAELLVVYLSNALENSGLAYSACITTIHYLIVKCNFLPRACERLLFDKTFGDVQLQQQAQRDRCAVFQIFERLLERNLRAFLSFNDDFILGFIQSAQGEVDPRCLMVVFRIFCVVAHNFRLGLFVDDFFEVVACYYPIEFNPSDKDKSSISRDMLVNACEQCLVAHPSFGPFTYQLLAEKLLDDEVNEPCKLEICSFLVRACVIFPAAVLREQLDDILGGIRMVAFDTSGRNAGSEMPESVLSAISAIVCRFSDDLENGFQSIGYLCDNLIENCEPFVLEADLGLTKRALALLETLAYAYSITSANVIENVFKWLFQLANGETVHTVADRSEVMTNGANWLMQWSQIACQTENKDILLRYSRQFLVLADCSSTIAKAVRYGLCRKLLPVFGCDSDFDTVFKRLLSNCFEDVGCGSSELRLACLRFVRAFSRTNWADFAVYLSTLEASNNEVGQASLFAIQCFAVHDQKSAEFITPFICKVLASSPNWTPSILDSLVEVFASNRSNEQLCRHLIDSVLRVISHSNFGENSDNLAATFQDIGLCLSTENHCVLVDMCSQYLTENPGIVSVLYLVILQSREAEKVFEMLKSLAAEGHFYWYLILLIAAFVNKAPDVEEAIQRIKELKICFSLEQQLKSKGRICKMLLLRNDTFGLQHLQQLLSRLEVDSESTFVLESLCDLLNFEKRDSDPMKCGYQCTVLWRQRIFCQFVTGFLDQYNAAGSLFHRNNLLKLLSPLLAYAERISECVTLEFSKLLPVFCDAFGEDLVAEVEEKVFSALSRFFLSSVDPLDDQFVSKAVLRLKDCAVRGRTMQIRLDAIACLNSLVQRCSKRILLPHFGDVVNSLTIATGSHKRLIRTAAASTKNLWELKSAR